MGRSVGPVLDSQAALLRSQGYALAHSNRAGGMCATTISISIHLLCTWYWIMTSKEDKSHGRIHFDRKTR